MPKVKIEELTPEAFRPYGAYANLLDPDAEAIGDGPVRFFRDLLPLAITHPRSLPCFSVCRVERRPLVVDVTEMHSWTAEGNLALDADALFHVAPATPNGVCPKDRIRVFRQPRGTFVSLNAGVWHHAPFVHGGAAALNMLVVLPERTYANDCLVVQLLENEKIAIES